MNTFFSYLERYSEHIHNGTLENDPTTNAGHAVQKNCV